MSFGWNMKRILALTYIIFISANTSVCFAEASDVDWKFYGGAPTDDGHTLCFYDANGVVREPAGQIRVWIKCLLQKEADAINIKKSFDGRILDGAARKVARYYVPPIAKVETLNSDQAMSITTYEETADISDIQPRAQIFYELNCPEKMERELSISILNNGKHGDRDKPSEWKYIPPEGNAARLLRLICPAD
jgi:hypothetical protein